MRDEGHCCPYCRPESESPVDIPSDCVMSIVSYLLYIDECSTTRDQFTCSNGRSIPCDYVCDTIDDCPDREDELECQGKISNTELIGKA